MQPPSDVESRPRRAFGRRPAAAATAAHPDAGAGRRRRARARRARAGRAGAGARTRRPSLSRRPRHRQRSGPRSTSCSPRSRGRRRRSRSRSERQSTRPPEPAAEPEPEPEVALSDDEELIAKRDEALAPIAAALMRKLKRALQDEQNEVLDRLRRHGGRRPALDHRLPRRRRPRQRYRDAARAPARRSGRRWAPPGPAARRRRVRRRGRERRRRAGRRPGRAAGPPARARRSTRRRRLGEDEATSPPGERRLPRVEGQRLERLAADHRRQRLRGGAFVAGRRGRRCAGSCATSTARAPTATTTRWPGRRPRARRSPPASSTRRPTPAAAACWCPPPPRVPSTVRIPDTTDRRAGAVAIPATAIWLIVAAVVLLFLVTSLRGIAGFYTDYLWFDELGFTSVWRGVLGAKVAPRRRLHRRVLRRPCGPASPSPTGSRRGSARSGPRTRSSSATARSSAPTPGSAHRRCRRCSPLIAGGGVVVAVAALDPVPQQRRSASTTRSSAATSASSSSGCRSCRFVVDWLFVALVIITFVTIVAHYLNGGIRLPDRRSSGSRRRSRRTSRCCSRCWRWSRRPATTSSASSSARRRGAWSTGPTLHRRQRPAAGHQPADLRLAHRLRAVPRQHPAPGLGAARHRRGPVAVPRRSSSAASYPAFIQRFRVEPAENERERPYIDRNIAATRAAPSASTKVETVPFDYSEDLDAADLAAQRRDDPQRAAVGPAVHQATRSRRPGAPRPTTSSTTSTSTATSSTASSPRCCCRRASSTPRACPTQSARGSTAGSQYTHGYGAVVSPANAVIGRQARLPRCRTCRPSGEPEINQPRIYYGENLAATPSSAASSAEIDFQERSGERTETTPLHGQGRRADWARSSAGPPSPCASATSTRCSRTWSRPESRGDLRPRHRRAGAQGGAVPPLRQRPVPGDHRRGPHRVGAGRLHDDATLPLRAAGRHRPARRRQRAAAPRSTTCATR